MKSIKFQILSAFFSAIIVALLLLAFLVYGHFSIVNLYKTQIDKMLLEYSLINQTAEVISSYNNYTKYANDQQREQAYLSAVQKINQTFSLLDVQISDPESRTAFQGLKNSINKVIEYTDNGYQHAKNNDISDLSSNFDLANKQYEFVRENITELILKELNFAQIIQADIDRTRKIDFTITTVIIAGVITLILIFAFWIANAITKPIAQLINIAQDIAAGDPHTVVSQKLKLRTDELGSLARSFNTMVENLRKNFDQLNQTNRQLTQAKNEFEEVNKRLSKMNQFMVNREIRMRELKKELQSVQPAKK